MSAGGIDKGKNNYTQKEDDMYHTEASLVIEQPIGNVFAVVSDVSRARDWQEGLVEANWTSEKALGIGSTYNFVSKFAGMRWDLPGKVTHWDPPNGWQWEARSGPFPVRGGYRLETSSSGTRITMFSDSEPRGWMNAMRPLLKWMGERSYRHSLIRLKALLEDERTVVSVPAAQ